MAESRWVNERFSEMGRELIEGEPELAYIRDSGARIAFLSSDAKKTSGGHYLYGMCEKVPEKMKWGLPFDFTVTVFEPNVEGMSEDQIRILILHELLHVGISTTKDGEEVYRFVPHDLQDFRLIVDRFGADWSAH